MKLIYTIYVYITLYNICKKLIYTKYEKEFDILELDVNIIAFVCFGISVKTLCTKHE